MTAKRAAKSHSRRWKRVRQHLRTFICGDLKKNWYIIPAVCVVMLLLEWMGLVRGFETYALDAFLLASLESKSSEIMLVVIDEEDYQQLYGGRSPLDEEQLRKLLLAIHAGQPRIIAVDLDTSHVTAPDFPWTPNTVWARDARSMIEGDRSGNKLIPVALAASFRQVKGADGAMETLPPSGLSVFPADSDGVIRRYRRVLKTSSESDSPSSDVMYVDSFPAAIVKALRTNTGEHGEAESHTDAHTENGHSSHDLILSFSTDRSHFPKITSETVVTLADKGLVEQELKGRIVIVGGTYFAARDLHPTPVGALPGVELVAEAVEADLHHAGIRPFDHKWAILFDAAGGLLFLYLNHLIPIRANFLLNIPLIGFLSLLASFLAFHAFAYWLNFTVVLVSLWIHFLWEKAREHGELCAQLEACRQPLEPSTVASPSGH